MAPPHSLFDESMCIFLIFHPAVGLSNDESGQKEKKRKDTTSPLTSAAVASCVSTRGRPLAFFPPAPPSSPLLLLRERFRDVCGCSSDSELVMILVFASDTAERTK
ncbi:hypothetical protein IG631_14958 [Alternaria alternata]|nr:hypothetical protein IG631_14958 [Alternaria alternata]